METRYTKAMKNPKFAKILEAEALIIHLGELLAEAMNSCNLDKFFLASEAGIEMADLQDILDGKKAEVRDLSNLFFAMGLRLEITAVPLSDS